MAGADLVITVMYMPRMISAIIRSYEWLINGTLGNVLCKIVPTLHLASVKVSILTLVFISIERLLAVSPFTAKKLTTGSVKIIIICIWLVSLAVHVPHMHGLKLKLGQGGAMVCRVFLNKVFGSSKGRKTYDNVLAVAFYAIPLCLIIILYTLAAIKLRRRNVPESAGVDSGKARRSRIDKINSNAFEMLFAVTLAFICCWLCFFVMRKGVIGIRISCNVQFIRNFLAHTNSAITPCLYIIFSQKYRNGFRSILKRVACCDHVRLSGGRTLSLISGRGRISWGTLSLLSGGVSLVSLNVLREGRVRQTNIKT